MKKAIVFFAGWIYPKKQIFGSLFCQEMIQMLIALDFTTCQVLRFPFPEQNVRVIWRN